MKNILIIGATSAIVEATARIWAKEGHHLYLVARNAERLEIIAQDLKIRGAASVHTELCDLNDFAEHQHLITKSIQTLGSLDITLIGHGTLGNQKACEQDFKLTLQELNTNAFSVLSLLTHLANYFEQQQTGTIAVISSVAGDRGRQSNYIYGTAKGAVSIFTEGLRQRLSKAKVQVLTIKPGFVDTPMTQEFNKNFLWTSPQKVGEKIHQAINKGKNIIYVPWFWRGIMTIIRLIPERLFKRLHL